MADVRGPGGAKAGSVAAGRNARLVAVGILLSRLAGFARDRAIAHYFGTSLFADVFRTALRMPNALQNLLGEGTLSASFIPVYAELLEQGREEEAGRVAGAVFALLLAVAGAIALLGVVLAPVLVDVLVPGFEGPRRELTIASIRIIFPMTGVLVLSAWALGILNSHRRFFVAYVAPVLWNAAMIGALVFFGGRLAGGGLVIALSWGALIGGLLQFGVQLPWVLRLERRLRIRWDTRLAGVREAVRNAGPAIAGRGVVQLSAYLDVMLASLLAVGAVAALGYAQALYILPVSLFGMSVAAAELPELARQRGTALDELRRRVEAGLRRIALYVVPSVVGYLVLGEVVVAGLYQTGDFGRGDTLQVYVVLAGYAIGLLATTNSRLFASAFFALRDTRTPARYAFVRVVLAAVLGFGLMFQLDQIEVMGRRLGAAGLSFAAGVAAWVEWGLLRRSLQAQIGAVSAGALLLAKMFLAAGAAAAIGRLILHVLPPLDPLLTAACVLIPYAALYFGLVEVLGVAEAATPLSRILRRRRGTEPPPPSI